MNPIRRLPMIAWLPLAWLALTLWPPRGPAFACAQTAPLSAAALQPAAEPSSSLERLSLTPELESPPPPEQPSAVIDSESPVWPVDATDLRFESDQMVQGGYYVDYDNGFVVRPVNPDESPFSMKVNHQNTFRYSGFSRGATSWTDSAGNVLPINNRGDFLIPRGRLIFSGNALAPEIKYLLNIDYNTAGANALGFRAFALSYQFSRALEVSVGQNKVPGTREWLLSSWVAQEGPDRSMATTFFRPSLSQGVWARGELVDRLYYHAMLCNGFNTLNQTPNQFTNRICFSDSIWWEPWGDFGAGYADLEHHENLVMRVGGCFTFAAGPGNQADGSSVENSAIRLSDGTVISQIGAFAPGVTLQRYDVALTTLDLAFKFRGFSVSSEFYFQELSSLKGNGPLPIDSTRAIGGFLQGGYFVLPQQVELYARSSFVTGAYGSGMELAGGFNWFPLVGKSNMRFTFDVANLESSPADQNRTGFVAGQTGVLFRTQINTSF